MLLHDEIRSYSTFIIWLIDMSGLTSCFSNKIRSKDLAVSRSRSNFTHRAGLVNEVYCPPDRSHSRIVEKSLSVMKYDGVVYHGWLLSLGRKFCMVANFWFLGTAMMVVGPWDTVGPDRSA